MRILSFLYVDHTTEYSKTCKKHLTHRVVMLTKRNGYTPIIKPSEKTFIREGSGSLYYNKGSFLGPREVSGCSVMVHTHRAIRSTEIPGLGRYCKYFRKKHHQTDCTLKCVATWAFQGLRCQRNPGVGLKNASCPNACNQSWWNNNSYMILLGRSFPSGW